MQYNFDQVLDRRHSDSIKWNAYPEDVIPLWVADMDFVSPQPVIRALQERVEQGVFGYPVGLGNQPRRLTRITPPDRRAHGGALRLDHRAAGYPGRAGCDRGFNLASYCTTVPGSGVMIQTPVYPPILRAAQETSCTHQEMELTLEADGSYSVDWQAFEDSLTPDNLGVYPVQPA